MFQNFQFTRNTALKKKKSGARREKKKREGGGVLAPYSRKSSMDIKLCRNNCTQKSLFGVLNSISPLKER